MQSIPTPGRKLSSFNSNSAGPSSLAIIEADLDNRDGIHCFYQDESYANTNIAHKKTWMKKPTQERLGKYIRKQESPRRSSQSE